MRLSILHKPILKAMAEHTALTLALHFLTMAVSNTDYKQLSHAHRKNKILTHCPTLLINGQAFIYLDPVEQSLFGSGTALLAVIINAEANADLVMEDERPHQPQD